MQRFLWAIEVNPLGVGGHWHLLPTTINVRRYHCEHDIKDLRREYPLERYRIVKYGRLEATSWRAWSTLLGSE